MCQPVGDGRLASRRRRRRRRRLLLLLLLLLLLDGRSATRGRRE